MAKEEELKKEMEVKKEKKIKKALSTFNKEFRKSTNTAIIAAFGFLIALSWKDLITEYVNVLSSYSPLQGQLISTLIVTTVSVLGILVVTKIFSDKQEEEVTKEVTKEVKEEKSNLKKKNEK
ncbi:MAG: DUF5654 family protein [Nanoarchaeota archaeon]|nr:DUF5654 family protein [Nanoarchaeota archaeon]